MYRHVCKYRGLDQIPGPLAPKSGSLTTGVPGRHLWSRSLNACIEKTHYRCRDVFIRSGKRLIVLFFLHNEYRSVTCLIRSTEPRRNLK